MATSTVLYWHDICSSFSLSSAFISDLTFVHKHRDPFARTLAQRIQRLLVQDAKQFRNASIIWRNDSLALSSGGVRESAGRDPTPSCSIAKRNQGWIDALFDQRFTKINPSL